jgi:hypothetical protein
MRRTRAALRAVSINIDGTVCHVKRSVISESLPAGIGGANDADVAKFTPVPRWRIPFIWEAAAKTREQASR